MRIRADHAAVLRSLCAHHGSAVPLVHGAFPGHPPIVTRVLSEMGLIATWHRGKYVYAALTAAAQEGLRRIPDVSGGLGDSAESQWPPRSAPSCRGGLNGPTAYRPDKLKGGKGKGKAKTHKQGP